MTDITISYRGQTVHIVARRAQTPADGWVALVGDDTTDPWWHYVIHPSAAAAVLSAAAVVMREIDDEANVTAPP